MLSPCYEISELSGKFPRAASFSCCRFSPSVPSLMHKAAFARDHSYLAPKGLTIAPHQRMKMRAFCGCHDHQMIPSIRFKIMSNIKTLASVTARISAMSTSAVLFFVMVPCASCISSNSRYLARYIKDPGKKEGC